ncbi:PQQ-dependent sugar dehydrogenase [Cryomorpha ignava]
MITSKILSPTFCLLLSIVTLSCSSQKMPQATAEYDKATTVETAIGPLVLPSPYAEESKMKISNVIGWEESQTPIAPAGFTVSRFASDLKHPRWAYVAPNGDVFIAEADTRGSANQITLLRDNDGDGNPEKRVVFAEGLNSNFGMLVLNGYFYVANTDGLYRWTYTAGQEKLEGNGEKILDLPAGGYNNHWTRNLLVNKDRTKIYVSVGSASNVGDHGIEEEHRRANILEINPDGTGEIIYATGLRNPVGMDWNPVTNELWTAVNERDKLGDNLVPDYITSVEKDGFYGWPFSYYGQVKDPRWTEDPHEDLVAKAIVPDVPLGNHTASLGLAFYTGDQFPAKYQNGAFVGQHGSWNRSEFTGYKVVFVPFENGKPGQPEDFLTGFLKDGDGSKVHGRPVGVTQMPDGSVLVMDDNSNIVWRVVAD